VLLSERPTGEWWMLQRKTMPVPFKNYVVRSNNFRTASEMTLLLLKEFLPLVADTVVCQITSCME
jgi:hypothetical protein